MKKIEIEYKEGNEVDEIEMVFVEGGDFLMGSFENNENAEVDERPQHEVNLSDYHISKYPITQKLWKEIMGNNPSEFKEDNNPVDSINWYEAVSFCNELSIRTNLEPYYNIDDEDISINKTANGFRLPTEAEWEYAARGGNKSQGYEYAGSNNIDDVAWYDKNSNSKTHAVGEKQANELGIYDMTGNVFEWCWDWYGSYPSSKQIDPTGSSSKYTRVFRGGSWYDLAGGCRVTGRGYYGPYISHIILGFRVVSR